MPFDRFAMQMTVLIALAFVLALGSPQAEPLMRAGWIVPAGGVAVYLLGSAGLAWALGRWGLRRLVRAGGASNAVVRLHRRWQMLLQIWLVGGLGMLVACGLCHRLRMLPGMISVPLAAETATVAVFFLALLLHWRMGYPFERAVRWQVEQDLMLAGQPVRSGWSARQYMDFSIRHHFLFVAIPVGLIMLVRDLLIRLAPAVLPAVYLPWAEPMVMIAAVGGVFFFSPLLLIHVWHSRPMPDGPLRRRLERLCRQVGLRYRQVRIWDTGGVMVNAGVMGLQRSVRYILISDALLENMDDRQILAVFGHEAGHVEHRHMAYFAVFMVIAIQFSMMVTVGVARLAPGPWVSELLAPAGMVAVVFGLGFGWLSRQFERQADVFGAWCVGMEAASGTAPRQAGGELAAGASVFVGALENVARLNGTSRQTRSWRHGSIAGRVAFVIGWAGAGYSRKAFDRSIVRIKLLLWLLLAGGAATMALTWRQWV